MKRALSSTFSGSATQAKHDYQPATRPFSVRLTDAERRRLEGEAGSQALGIYVRARLLYNAARRRSSAPGSDRTLLSQILGKLGRLQLTSSLSDLAIAADIGAIAMTPDLEQEVRSACRDIHDMRTMLMRALGLRPEARA